MLKKGRGIKKMKHIEFKDNFITKYDNSTGRVYATRNVIKENDKLLEGINQLLDITPWTFIIKDQQSFLDWANNLDEFDYTNVLIFPGSYLLENKGINLSNSKTYRVKGVQIGGKVPIIIFKNSPRGFYYDREERNKSSNTFDLAEMNGYSFENIPVIMDQTESPFIDATGMENMSDISNVTIEFLVSRIEGAVVNRYRSFLKCRNIFRSCPMYKDENQMDSKNPMEYIAFDHCNNIRNTITVLEGSNPKGHIIRFDHCRNYDDSNILYS